MTRAGRRAIRNGGAWRLVDRIDAKIAEFRRNAVDMLDACRCGQCRLTLETGGAPVRSRDDTGAPH